ncbi:protease inhibitor I42 family protein [Aurantibacillus circumpalustris]|uniref:protease inhibitor I42 family protein n=1 Tax=Aurantibacillus circumpalustris TaxID=3036359 RepID=UPI00295BEE85|nr:protease inhibitor I42 family protein [Aurantibacillus circumpalustris]
MKKLTYFASFLAIITFFLSCTSFPEAKKESPEINEVPPNSNFKIVLPENHTTGYIWQLKQDYDPTVISQINEVWHGNDKGIYFNLSALAIGQTTLTFISRKYRDTADIKHFIVKIGGN